MDDEQVGFKGEAFDIPDSSAEPLVGLGDLAVTTDYRDVMGEILARRLNNPHLATVFPGYEPRFAGVVQRQL